MVTSIKYNINEEKKTIKKVDQNKYNNNIYENVDVIPEEMNFDEEEMDIHEDTFDDLEFDDTYYGFSEIDSFSEEDIDKIGLDEEDIERLKGTMTQEEYDKYIEGMTDYYDEQIKILESLLYGYEGTDGESSSGLEGLLDDINAFMAGIPEADSSIQLNNALLLKRIEYYIDYGDVLNLFEGTGVTKEDFLQMDNDSKIEFLKQYDKETQVIIGNINQTYESYNQIVKEKFGYLGIETYNDLLAYKEKLIANIQALKNAINTTKNIRDSAEYDYLCFMKDYEEYDNTNNLDPIEIEKYKVNYYGRDAWDEGYLQYKLEFSYKDFVKDHPDVTPLEFIQMIEARYPGSHYTCDGIKNVEELKELYKSGTVYPEMLKKYNYLYDKDPERAKEFLKDSKYEINNAIGQLKAKEFLDKLYEVSDENELDELLYNEFEVHLKGLTDGLDTFGEGVGYSVEAILTLLGIKEENRVMSASAYEKMYILGALLSKEDKIKLDLLDEDGNNKDPNSIIDYTKEYAGKFLSNNYEISQGIGNMLPVILVSMINPTAGAWTMGVSVGGNSYHDAMVKGNNYFSSLIYGILSGASEAFTEKYLGGLPGISEGNKSIIMSMISEAKEESLQGILDGILRCAILNEDLPRTEDEWNEFMLDIGKQGLYGAITAGYINSFKVISSAISVHEVNQYIKKNNITKEELNSVIESIRNSNEDFKNLSDNEIIKSYGDMVIKNIKVNRLVSNGIDINIAMTMVENNVGEKVATYMNDNNVTSEELENALNNLSNSKRKYSNKSSEYLSSKFADDVIKQIKVNQLVASGVDSSIATLMINYNVDQPTAEFMKNNKVGANTAKYMMTNNINISGEITIEKLALTMPQNNNGEVIIPNNILQEFRIQLKKGHKIRYNQNTNTFERLDNNNKTMYTIPNDAINDPTKRVVKVGDTYIDQVTHNEYPPATFDNTQDGYDHIMNGEKVFDKQGNPKGTQGGHNFVNMKDNPDYIVEVYDTDPDTGVIYGTWTYSNGNFPNKPDHCWFPESWDEPKISSAVNQVLQTEPVAVHINKDGKAMYYGVVDGVPILVFTQGGEVETAFPALDEDYNDYMSQNQWVDIRSK